MVLHRLLDYPGRGSCADASVYHPVCAEAEVYFLLCYDHLYQHCGPQVTPSIDRQPIGCLFLVHHKYLHVKPQ